MKPIAQARDLINHLTNNEDIRQELWLHYLEGNELSSLYRHLEQISAKQEIESEIQSQLWDMFKNPPSDRFQKLLTRFSEVEQSVICLLALGLTISQVSGYKGISEIRIKQIVSVIKDNDCWEELYGTQKETHR